MLNHGKFIVDPILSVLNLGDSYNYPDIVLSVNENFISFDIDLEDEKIMEKNLHPKAIHNMYII